MNIISSVFFHIVGYKYSRTILFYSIIILLIYLNRKKFDIEMKIVALLRTKIGLKFMDKTARKFRRPIRFLGYSGIVVGYIGMIFITYELIKILYKTIKVPGTVGAAPVLPGMPIAGTGLVIPLIAGWLALFFIVVVHEFSHGVVARAHNIKIKSSGIAFFGPLLAAFVEPDEKQLSKVPPKVAKSVFAAGPFANMILAAIVLALLLFAFSPIHTNLSKFNGVKVEVSKGFPAAKAGLKDGAVITKINNIKVNNHTELIKILSNTLPNQRINITTINGEQFSVITTTHPKNKSKGYIGIIIKGNYLEPKKQGIINRIIYKSLSWFNEFLFWVFFLSFNIGLINLFPIFITDGAKIIGVDFLNWFKNKKTAEKWWMLINRLGVALIALLFIIPLIRWILGLV